MRDEVVAMMKKYKLLLLLLVLFIANISLTFYFREQNKQKEDDLIRKTAREITESTLHGQIRK